MNGLQKLVLRLHLHAKEQRAQIQQQTLPTQLLVVTLLRIPLILLLPTLLIALIIQQLATQQMRQIQQQIPIQPQVIIVRQPINKIPPALHPLQARPRPRLLMDNLRNFNTLFNYFIYIFK